MIYWFVTTAETQYFYTSEILFHLIVFINVIPAVRIHLFRTAHPILFSESMISILFESNSKRHSKAIPTYIAAELVYNVPSLLTVQEDPVTIVVWQKLTDYQMFFINNIALLTD